MGTLTGILIDLAVLALVIARQLRPRPLGEGRLPLLLGVIGLLQVAAYSHGHHAGLILYAFLAASLAVAALLGAARAVTVRLWRQGGQLMRQGSWLTVLLWLVSAGLHVAAGAWLPGGAAGAGAPAAGGLLFIGATLGAQQIVLAARSRRLADGFTAAALAE